MFSETRYALSGQLRVAYRTTREGPRDIAFVSNWFTNCEILPELPSMNASPRSPDPVKSSSPAHYATSWWVRDCSSMTGERTS